MLEIAGVDLTDLILADRPVVDAQVVHHPIKISIGPIAPSDVLVYPSAGSWQVPDHRAHKLPVAVDLHDTRVVNRGHDVLPLVEHPEILHHQGSIVSTSTDPPLQLVGRPAVGKEQVVVGSVPEVDHPLPVAEVPLVGPARETHGSTDLEGSDVYVGEVTAVKVESLAKLASSAIRPARAIEDLGSGTEARGVVGFSTHALIESPMGDQSLGNKG